MNAHPVQWTTLDLGDGRRSQIEASAGTGKTWTISVLYLRLLLEYDHSARLGNFIHDVMMAIAMRPTRPAIAGPDPAYPSCGR